MEKEKKIEKKSKQNIYTAMIIVVAVMTFVGGFVLSDIITSFVNAGKNEVESTTDDVVIAGKTVIDGTLGYNGKYVVGDASYSLILGTYAGSTDSYFTLDYEDTMSKIKVTRYYYDRDETQEYTLSFPSNVVDVSLAAFSDDPKYNSVFFLLENGDICYSLIEEMSSNSTVPSYETIEGVSKIVKFYRAESCNADGKCVETTLAQATDKKIYDLYSYIVD